LITPDIIFIYLCKKKKNRYTISEEEKIIISIHI